MSIKNTFFSICLAWLYSASLVHTHASNYVREADYHFFRHGVQVKEPKKEKKKGVDEKSNYLDLFWIVVPTVIALVGSWKWSGGYRALNELRKLIKPGNECISINYLEQKIWMNKDFVWFDTPAIRAYPENINRKELECSICFKEFGQSVIFLPCACGANIACVSCWQKTMVYSIHQTGELKCPFCQMSVSVDKIALMRSCLSHDYQIIVTIQNLLQGKANPMSITGFFTIDTKGIQIADREDSIEAWIRKRKIIKQRQQKMNEVYKNWLEEHDLLNENYSYWY